MERLIFEVESGPTKILQQKVQVKIGSELAMVKHGEGHLG